MDIVEAQARDRQRPSRERHEEDAVEEERDRREEPVSVGVAGEGELEHALLGRGARVRGGRRLRRLRPLERRAEPRLGSRRLARIRLAGHGVPDFTYRWVGLMKTHLVRLHKGRVGKNQGWKCIGRTRAAPPNRAPGAEIW